MKKSWLLGAVCGSNMAESGVKDNRFTLNLAEVEVEEMFRFTMRNSDFSKMSATVANDGTNDYLRIDASKLAKVAYKDGPEEYGEMWYTNGDSELAADFQVYCLGLDVALFSADSILYLNSEGYDDDDNDYNRQLFKINTKRQNQESCDFDDLEFEESFCIDLSKEDSPTWTRIETRSFEPKSQYLQFSFMTKKPSVIGIRNMTLEDCTNESLSKDEIKEKLRKAEETAMLATASPGMRALYLAEAADREIQAAKEKEKAENPVEKVGSCEEAKANGKKGYQKGGRWISCSKRVKAVRPTKTTPDAVKRVTLPTFVQDKLDALGFSDGKSTAEQINQNQQQQQQQQHQPNNEDQSEQQQYDPNDSRYVAPGGGAKNHENFDNSNGFKITRDNYETSLEEMMSEIEVWKVFHDHIHHQLATQPNTTTEEEEKVKPRNKEISMFENTPVVKTTKSTTTRPSLPSDWNPPGIANVYKPDLSADPQFWFDSQLYMTTEAMVELVLEMEEFNERVNAQEQEGVEKATSRSISLSILSVLVIALFAV